MPHDPYMILRALLRAEAVRGTPKAPVKAEKQAKAKAEAKADDERRRFPREQGR